MNDDQHGWFERVGVVAALARSEASAIEEAGGFTIAMLAALRESELFWATIPTEFGGGGTDIVTALRIIEMISRADGSVGWTLMANMNAAAVACAYLPNRALETVFAANPRPIFAGMLAPRGSATPMGDGFVVSGEYRFGSGVVNADWVGGGVFVRDAGVVRKLPSGAPDIRSFFVPRASIEVVGNWDVLGLRGTASVDYNIVQQFVDEAFGFALPDPVALRPIPSYQLGLGPTGAAGHGAVAIGIAMRAFEELAAIVGSKRRPGFPGIVDQQLFLHDFASKEASLQAARSWFFACFQSAYDTAFSDGEITIIQKQRLRQAVTHATYVAADVVKWCYTWGGSDSLRNPSPLGRCLRDISAATQHVFVDHNTLVAVSADLLAEWAT